MTTIAGAGLLIIDRGYALCGLSPKTGKYSGIGGKQEPGETIRQTAFREAVEELFGIDPSELLVNTLVFRFINNAIVERKNYLFILMNFADVFEMNKIVCQAITVSPYYKTFPSSILDLAMNRYPTEDAEITDLNLTKYGCPTLLIDREFIKDCTLAEALIKAYGTNKTTPHLGRFPVAKSLTSDDPSTT